MVYCTHCGLELDENAQFCSGCGNSLADVSRSPVKARDWELHVGILGWLVIAHSAITGLIGLVIMVAGQFLGRFLAQNPGLLEQADPNDIPPPEVIALIVPISFLIGMIFLIVAVPSVAAGIGLLRYRSWGRVLTIVLSFLRLLEFPFGTATAIYSFWVLLSQGGKSFYRERAMRAEV